MNKKLLFLISLLFFSVTAYSVTWNVTTAGFMFSPDSITIAPGDSVMFQITPNHSAGEVSQATWNANGSTPLPGFSVPFGGGLVLPAQLAAGVHYYVCGNHFASGMKGRIFVTAPAEVDAAAVPERKLNVFPNPVKDMLSVIRYPLSETRTIEIFDSVGQKVYSNQLSTINNRLTIDVSELPSGIYFVILRGEKNNTASSFIKQ